MPLPSKSVPHGGGIFDKPCISTRPRGRVLCAIRLLLFLAALFLVGPALGEVSVTPRISAGLTYDDNIYLDPSDEKSDVSTIVSPGIDLNLTSQTAELLLSYNPTYSVYTRFPENNYLGHSANLTGWTEVVGGTRLEISDTFLYTEDPISETDTTVRRGREPYWNNTAEVGLVNRFGAENVAGLRYAYFVNENDDPTVEDRSYHNPKALMTYWFSPNQYAVDLEGGYTVSEFDISEDYEELAGRVRLTKRFGRRFDAYLEYNHEITDYLEEGEDYQVYSPLVGFAWQERQNTRFAASFGYFYQDNDISEDDDGIVGTLETAYAWAEGSAVTLIADAGYDKASFGSENLGFNPYFSLSGTVTHPLGRRVTGNLFGGYRRNQYTDEEPDREDTIWRAGCGLAYQALPWLTLRLDYLFQDVDSNVDEEDYTDNRGILTVVLSPRQPVKLFK